MSSEAMFAQYNYGREVVVLMTERQKSQTFDSRIAYNKQTRKL
jgi:hypothetical protein